MSKQPIEPGATRTLAPSPHERVPDAHPADELPTGNEDRYERIAEHARGGLGQIWRARDRYLGRTVALKELLRPTDHSEARFIREAMITARLEHPSIVAVHDAGRSGAGRPYYTMKLVAGKSLGERIEAAREPRDRMALLPHVIAVADAVAYAHQHRIIHRDLKPANVLVGDFGETVVVDWGLAKQLGDADLPSDAERGPYRERASHALTRVGSVLGTPAYMAPEQAAGADLDERVDVYALGALLYHLMAGAPPYPASDPDAVLEAVLAGPPRDLAEVAPAAPPDLVAIVRKAMARAPEGRYRTARQLAEDLRRFQTGQLVSVHPYTVLQLLGRWARRHRTAVAVGVLALVALAVIGAISVQRVVQARAVADQRLTDSLVDQGRLSLLAGSYHDAVAHLARAYARGAEGPPVRVMLRQAARAFEAETATLVHPSRIWEVDYASDGRWLLVTTEAGAHLWDGRTGAFHRRLTGHGRQVRVARFDTGAARVATGGDDGTARVWDAASGRELLVLEDHEGSVRDLGFSPDGRLLATATPAGAVRIWDDAGTLRARLDAHPGWIWRVVFSPDGAVLASAGGDGIVNLWDPDSGQLVHALRGHGAAVRNLAFDDAGERLVSVGFDHVAIVWDTRRGEPLARFEGHQGAIIGARFSPDGRRVLTAGLGAELHLWDATTGAPVRSFRGHRGAIYWATFGPDGAWIASAGWDGTARIWDADSGTEALSLAGHEGPLIWGALSPDGAVLATSSWDGTVRMWNTVHRNQVRSLGGEAAAARRVRFGPDGEIVTCGPDAIEIFDARGGDLALRIPVEAPPSDCRIDATGRRVAAVDHQGGVRVWSARDGALTHAFATDGPPLEALAFDASGARLAVVGRGDARLWELASEQSARFSPHEHGTSVDISRDGTRLLTAGTDGTTRVWRLAAPGQPPALERTIAAHDYIVARARFGPDGTRIATASYDGRARIWDAASGALVADLDDHAGEVYAVAFHPSGQLVATASSDVASVWDLGTARPIARFRGHTGAVRDVAFGPGGDVLATSATDGLIKLWDTSAEQRSPDEVTRAVECLLGAAVADDGAAAAPIATDACSRVVRRVPDGAGGGER